jgi:hypothetical protein
MMGDTPWYLDAEHDCDTISLENLDRIDDKLIPMSLTSIWQELQIEIGNGQVISES